MQLLLELFGNQGLSSRILFSVGLPGSLVADRCSRIFVRQPASAILFAAGFYWRFAKHLPIRQHFGELFVSFCYLPVDAA
jgi:hypothetical protein